MFAVVTHFAHCALQSECLETKESQKKPSGDAVVKKHLDASVVSGKWLAAQAKQFFALVKQPLHEASHKAQKLFVASKK